MLRRWKGGATGLLWVGVAALLAGCEEFTGTTSTGTTGAGGASTTSSTSGSTASVTTSTTGVTSSSTGMDPCDTLGDGDTIPGTCGVFVKEGGNGTGTPENPFGTLADALNVAIPAQARIYVCTGTFPENLEVPEGMTLVGGADCAGTWKVRLHPTAEQRTTIAPAAGPVVTFYEHPGATSVGRVSGFTFRAADALFAGESSVAVVVDTAPIEFVECRFEAGKGVSGKDAAMSTQMPVAGTQGNEGSANTAVGCGSPGAPIPGAAAKTNPSCASTGGKGGTSGDGTGTDAQPGDDGTPQDPMHPTAGQGGPGATCPSGNCGVCAPGTAGQDGGAGTPGNAGVGLGSYVGSFEGVSGGTGDVGKPGGGGGGGGGAVTTNGCGGDSGGSGGPGGCGGAGGPGGTYGGSSFGVVVIGTANVSFLQCSAKTSPAGRGGNGAPGVMGAAGGPGGYGGDHNPNVIVYATNACAGGKGGAGGQGGHGGGGSGGHSIGLACFSTACPDTTGITFDPVDPSYGGAKGLGDGSNDGSPGQYGEKLEF